jgi:hypothetical protein
MADSTVWVAVVTGISTISAGVGGAYLTARQQGETARREVDARREQAAAEAHQQVVDRRLESYREFLDVERQLRMLVASGRDFANAEFEEWLATFNRTYNLVVLTGTRAAHEHAEKLFTELRVMDGERMADQSSADFAEKFRNAFANHDDTLRQIRDDLIDTMRSDVAPDRDDVERGRHG